MLPTGLNLVRPSRVIHQKPGLIIYEGFMLGYELHAVLQNQISMSNGFTDAEKWLNETDWHTTNNITFAGNNGLAITGYTPALKGAEGNAYSFDVSIGSPV